MGGLIVAVQTLNNSENMTQERWNEVMNQEDDNEKPLTPEEIAQGWHFCQEWDGLLVGPGMEELESCDCSPR